MSNYYWRLTVHKGYNPDQPRVPAGQPGGGQWTSASAFSTAATTANIADAEPLGGGVCDSEIIAYEGDGHGVWKSLSDDSGFHDGNSEVAAYRISELLGLDIVPETVFAENEKGYPGTSQMFVYNATVGRDIADQLGVDVLDRSNYHLIGDRMVEYTSENYDRIQKMALLDYIIGNGDRHPGNVIVDAGGLLWAIDHGHTSWRDWRKNSTRDTWLSHPQQTQLRPELVERIKRLSFDDFMGALSDVSEDGRVVKRDAWQRIVDLKLNGGVLEGG